MSDSFKKWVIPYSNSTEIDWDGIQALEISEFPWYEVGTKQATSVKMAYTEEKLYLKVASEDQWSYACMTELNSQVCEDSCVEFFFTPRNDRGTPYFNVEVNCIGTPHFAYGPGRENRMKSTQAQADTLNVSASFHGPLKEEQESDQSWDVEFSIPLNTLKQWIDEDLKFEGSWWANFYRCGGRKEPQYASWNNIHTENPDYHRPEQFGQLVFGPKN